MIRENLQVDDHGHLSELALSAFADGQIEALSAATHLHLEECEHCQGRLADAIVEYAAAAEAMVLAKPKPVAARPPWRWITAAAMGLLVVRTHALTQSWALTHQSFAHAKRALPLALRSLTAETSWLLTLSTTTAALALVAALAVWTRRSQAR